MNDRSDQGFSFEALRGQLDGDPRPVKPFNPGRSLTIFALVSMTTLAALLWALYGWRADFETLGMPGFLGFSAVELAVAIALAVWVLRETIPAMRPSAAGLTLAATGAAVAHAALTWGTYLKSPNRVPEGKQWMYGIYCLRYEVALAIPCLLFVLWLGHRGLTARSRWVGALGGMAAGLAADSVWRLFCPYTDALHAVASHTLGILSTAVLGGLVAVTSESLKARQWRSRKAA